MSERHDTGFGWFIFGFLLGGLVGAVLSLAYAPQSGEETRQQIREKGIELRGRAEQAVERARERFEELSEQARTQAGQVREQVSKGVETARKYGERLRTRKRTGAPAEETGEPA